MEYNRQTPDYFEQTADLVRPTKAWQEILKVNNKIDKLEACKNNILKGECEQVLVFPDDEALEILNKRIDKLKSVK